MDKKKLEKLILYPAIGILASCHLAVAGTVGLGLRALWPQSVEYRTDDYGVIDGFEIKENTFLGSTSLYKGEYTWGMELKKFESIDLDYIFSKKNIALSDEDLDGDVDRIFINNYFKEDNIDICCSQDYLDANPPTPNNPKVSLCNEAELNAATKLFQKKKKQLNYEKHMGNIGKNIKDVEETERLKLLKSL